MLRSVGTHTESYDLRSTDHTESPPFDTASLHRLTARENEVLSQVAQGKNNAAIAEALVLSERGVEKHINSLFRKLDLTDEHRVNRRVMAVLLYQAAHLG